MAREPATRCQEFRFLLQVRAIFFVIFLKVHFTPAKQPTLEAKAQIQVTGANEQIVDVEDEKFLETLDDWTYLKMMGIGRNWEIPRQRLTISATLLGGGEFGLVKRGSYERRNGRKLTVAVKLLKGTHEY